MKNNLVKERTRCNLASIFNSTSLYIDIFVLALFFAHGKLFLVRYDRKSMPVDVSRSISTITHIYQDFSTSRATSAIS